MSGGPIMLADESGFGFVGYLRVETMLSTIYDIMRFHL